MSSAQTSRICRRRCRPDGRKGGNQRLTSREVSRERTRCRMIQAEWAVDAMVDVRRHRGERQGPRELTAHFPMRSSPPSSLLPSPRGRQAKQSIQGHARVYAIIRSRRKQCKIVVASLHHPLCHGLLLSRRRHAQWLMVVLTTTLYLSLSA